MPTSSIFTNIVINDPEKVEKFIDALEASSHDPASSFRRLLIMIWVWILPELLLPSV